jgi:hypothetical protein
MTYLLHYIERMDQQKTIKLDIRIESRASKKRR